MDDFHSAVVMLRTLNGIVFYNGGPNSGAT